MLNWFGLVKCELFRRAPSLRWVQVGPLNPLLEMFGDQFVAQKRAKSAQKRTKKRKSAQIQFQVLIGTQDSLAPTPGAICVGSRTNTTVTGLYQLGYPRVAKQRCTIAQGPVSSSFFTNERFFKTCWKSEFVPDFFRT